jgi:hypothetical protein
MQHPVEENIHIEPEGLDNEEPPLEVLDVVDSPPPNELEKPKKQRKPRKCMSEAQKASLAKGREKAKLNQQRRMLKEREDKMKADGSLDDDNPPEEKPVPVILKDEPSDEETQTIIYKKKKKKPKKPPKIVYYSGSSSEDEVPSVAVASQPSVIFR